MDTIQESRDHWLKLAADEDSRAAWDANSRPASTHRAESYRRVARALEIEMETGTAVCSCCFKPFGRGMR